MAEAGITYGGVETGRIASGWLFDEFVSPDAKLRQGDFIRFESETNPLQSFGIVVTADCDLEQRKHARLVTLVPVLDAKSILEIYLIPEDCDRKRDMIERYIFGEFNIPSDQDYDTKIVTLMDILSSNNGGIDGVIMAGANLLLDRASRTSVSDYRLIMSKIKSSPKKIEAFKQQIRSKGDLLVLPDTEVFGLQGGVAWVRNIWQVPVSDIAIRTSELQRRTGERMARLDSPFRYRLTQLMSHVFSDIGLPSTSDRIDEILDESYSDA